MGLLPLEDSELLAKRGSFQSKSVAWHQKRAEVGDQHKSERNHQSDLM